MGKVQVIRPVPTEYWWDYFLIQATPLVPNMDSDNLCRLTS